MKCDQCDNEATVHDTTIQKGAMVERHLCESCARAAGLLPPGEASSPTIVPFGPGQIVISTGPFPGQSPTQPPTKPPTKAPAKPAASASPPESDEPSVEVSKVPGKGKVVVVAGGPAGPKIDPCATCGMTYAEFKRTGLMGCEACYRAFESQLLPLIERAHEGGSFHIGKTPKRLATHSPERLALALAEAEARAQRIRALMRELDAAVAGEKYELAAKLRDQLRRMQQGGPQSSATA